MRWKRAPSRVRPPSTRVQTVQYGYRLSETLCPDRAGRSCASVLGRSSATKSQHQSSQPKVPRVRVDRVGFSYINWVELECPGPILARRQVSRRICAASFPTRRTSRWRAPDSSHQPLLRNKLHNGDIGSQGNSPRLDSYSGSARRRRIAPEASPCMSVLSTISKLPRGGG